MQLMRVVLQKQSINICMNTSITRDIGQDWNTYIISICVLQQLGLIYLFLRSRSRSFGVWRHLAIKNMHCRKIPTSVYQDKLILRETRYLYKYRH